MSVKRKPSINSLECSIRLHLRGMSKIASRETSLNLLWFFAETCLLVTGRKTLINLYAEPLKIPFELSSDAHCAQQSLVVEVMIAAPFRILFPLCNKCLVYVEVRQMVPFFNSEFPARAFHCFLFSFMVKPNRSLETNHGGDRKYLTQATKRGRTEKYLPHHREIGRAHV